MTAFGGLEPRLFYEPLEKKFILSSVESSLSHINESLANRLEQIVAASGHRGIRYETINLQPKANHHIKNDILQFKDYESASTYERVTYLGIVFVTNDEAIKGTLHYTKGRYGTYEESIIPACLSLRLDFLKTIGGDEYGRLKNIR